MGIALPLSLVSFRCRIRCCERRLAKLADDLRRHIIARLAQNIRPQKMRFHEFRDQFEAPALGGPGRKIVAEQQHRAHAHAIWLVVMDLDTRLTVCYVMNRMEAGLEGDLRGANLVLAAAVAVAEG